MGQRAEWWSLPASMFCVVCTPQRQGYRARAKRLLDKEKLKLYTPSNKEAALLLTCPAQFIGLRVYDEALPPAFLLKRAIEAEDDGWSMPRLFCDEVRKAIVGSGAFKSEPRGRRVEIGYGVSPSCRGLGYATAGVELLLEEAFTSGCVDEVFAEASPSNSASNRVLEKAGFSVIGDGLNDEGPVHLWSKRKPNQ